MKSFLEDNFALRNENNEFEVIAGVWVDVDFFCSVFDNELTNYDDMIEKCDDTGYEKILDNWKGRGII